MKKTTVLKKLNKLIEDFNNKKFKKNDEIVKMNSVRSNKHSFIILLTTKTNKRSLNAFCVSGLTYFEVYNKIDTEFDDFCKEYNYK